MKQTPTTLLALSATVVVVALALSTRLAHGQPASTAPAVKRTTLLQQDMKIPEREAVMVVVELPAGSAEGRHIHPTAELYVFVQEGLITLERMGQPNTTLKAGEVFTITPGLVHQAMNPSTSPAKLSVVFISEKGKPLTQAAQ